jgi:hypothetical protein
MPLRGEVVQLRDASMGGGDAAQLVDSFEGPQQTWIFFASREQIDRAGKTKHTQGTHD